MATPNGTCCVDGCGALANRVGAQMCEMHYGRVRRHGGTDKKTTLISGLLTHSGGYLLEHNPEHPLARGSSRVYQHRVVYYQHHGAGPFNCHWCGCAVTWDDMHVDHLNDDKKDNQPSNLVASCPTCNQARGKWKMVQKSREKHGIRIGDQVRTMNEWAAIAGIARTAIQDRLNKGWPIERAVFEPRGIFGPKSKKSAPR